MGRVAESDWLSKRFEEQGGPLRAVAYRMLGSLAEADDAVQDAWLRASRANGAPIENLRGWLTTIVARVSLNMLRARRTHSEESLGAHLPDPVVTGEGSLQPEEEALLADSGKRRAPAPAASSGPSSIAVLALTGARLPNSKLIPVLINGSAGVVITVGGRPFSMMGFILAGGKIVEMDAIVDSRRIARLAGAALR